MWSAHPDANIGVVTSGSRIVLDIDGAESRNALADAEAKLGRLPRTLTIRTGRGEHRWYTSNIEIRSSAGRLGRAVDVKAQGGYVIGAWSVHATGSRYETR